MLTISLRLTQGFSRRPAAESVRNIPNSKLIGEISRLKKNADSHIDRDDFD